MSGYNPVTGKFQAGRVDKNQPNIVKDLRWLGCDVKHLHNAGEGIPDLLIGIQGLNLLGEVKDGSKSPSKRKLNPQQKLFHRIWAGQKCVLKNSQDVELLVKATRTFINSIQPQLKLWQDSLCSLKGDID